MQKSKIRTLFLFLLLILYTVDIAQAEDFIINSGGTDHEHDTINKALESVHNTGGGKVYLKSGIYDVTGPVYIYSNTILTGDPDAILKVSEKSSQWFKGSIGIISCKESIKNVEIYGFQIDGNIGKLDQKLANSGSDTDHDCEKLIILGGYSNDFANNINIHDMKLYNSFSDGIYIRYAENVDCFNNFISNCQHEGIYFSVIKRGYIYKNKIAGITSDCARLDNCMICLIEYNTFFSYGGNSYGAYKHGENGLQIGDAGVSHGYDARKSDWHTSDIEVRYNTFSDPGLKAIWYHSGDNVYIHDNDAIDAGVLETMGIPIEDISADNQPTVEMSEEIFESIFDILNIEYTESAKTDYDASDFNYETVETEKGKIAVKFKIVGWNNLSIIDNVSYVSSPNDIILESSVIKNPSLDEWFGGISKINKTVSVEIKNGTAKATMNVSVKWYNYERDKTTGAKQKGEMHISNYTFTDSCPAPNIWNDPKEVRGIVYQYPTYFMLTVPSNNNLTSVKFETKNNYVEHVFLVGYKNTTSEGSKYTEFETLEHWEGNLTHQGNWVALQGEYSQENITVTANTPYTSMEVTDIEVIEKELPESVISYWFYPSLLFFGSLYLTFKFYWDRLPFH